MTKTEPERGRKSGDKEGKRVFLLSFLPLSFFSTDEFSETQRRRAFLCFFFLHFSIRFLGPLPPLTLSKLRRRNATAIFVPFGSFSGCSAVFFFKEDEKASKKEEEEKKGGGNQNNGPLSGGPTFRLRNRATKPAATGADA